MLSTSGLKFRYNNGPSFQFPDLSCDKGGKLLIIGESGRGKTTLLHLLAGILRPTEGKVMISGTDTTSLSDSALDKFRGKHVGIVFQTAHFVESVSVMDNLMLPAFLTGSKADHDNIKNTLSRLNIGDKANVFPSSLSVGEQQRVAIARAIMNKPTIILADEPTSALDDHNANEVIMMLEEQAAINGSGLVIVTHDKRLKDRFSNQISL